MHERQIISTPYFRSSPLCVRAQIRFLQESKQLVVDVATLLRRVFRVAGLGESVTACREVIAALVTFYRCGRAAGGAYVFAPFGKYQYVSTSFCTSRARCYQRAPDGFVTRALEAFDLARSVLSRPLFRLLPASHPLPPGFISVPRDLIWRTKNAILQQPASPLLTVRRGICRSFSSSILKRSKILTSSISLSPQSWM